MWKFLRNQTFQLMLAWTIILLQDIEMNDTPGVYIASAILFILLVTAIVEHKIAQAEGKK
jgi:hypothetical protein